MHFVEHDHLARQRQVTEHHMLAAQGRHQHLVDGADHEVGKIAPLPSREPWVDHRGQRMLPAAGTAAGVTV